MMVESGARSFGTTMVLALLCSCALSWCSGTAHAAGVENFSGSWSLNGSKEVLSLGTDREAALWHLSGHVNLDESLAGAEDYWASCVGLVDSGTGGDFRCVWRSLDGQEIYLSLMAEQLAKDIVVKGTLIGGSGAAAGIQGTLQFKWSTLMLQLRSDRVSVGGFSQDMRGSYQLP